MRARGEYVLMVDADGATKAKCLVDMLDRITSVEKNGLGIAIGSRAHLHEEDSTAKRKWYRVVLMHGFHLLVQLVIGGGGIKDTQCGFKLFSRCVLKCHLCSLSLVF
jgi:dolichyl-phosphate beta-glucosyltransferase